MTGASFPPPSCVRMGKFAFTKCCSLSAFDYEALSRTEQKRLNLKVWKEMATFQGSKKHNQQENILTVPGPWLPPYLKFFLTSFPANPDLAPVFPHSILQLMEKTTFVVFYWSPNARLEWTALLNLRMAYYRVCCHTGTLAHISGFPYDARCRHPQKIPASF